MLPGALGLCYVESNSDDGNSMRQPALIALFFLSLTAVDAGEPVDEPTLYEATYSARYNNWPINGERTLTRTGDVYHLVNQATNFLGRIQEEERFLLSHDGQLRPLSYSYRQRILGRGREEILEIDQGAGEAVHTRRGQTTRFEVEPHHLGPLSYQVQIGLDLEADVDSLNYEVIYRGDIRTFRFEHQGEEVIDTPMGSFDTVKLERVRDTDDRETLLWLAPALNYLPVKLQQLEDGERYEMHLKGLKGLGYPRT